MQKVTFHYEIIIHDDASTDRTPEILSEYQQKFPDLLNIIFQTENQYSIGIKPLQKYVWPINKGKYIALCEGDDYWTDSLKLQKQVDYLEANPEYGMVYTNYHKLFEGSNEIVKPDNDPHISDGDIYYKYLTSSFIGTLTVLARSDLIKEFGSNYQDMINTWRMGDRPLWLYIASKSKCGFISDYTAVYRRNANSISSFQDIYKEIDFLKSSYDIRFYFIEHVRSVPEEIRVKMEDTYNQELLSLYFKANDKTNGRPIFRKIKHFRVQDYLRFIGMKNFFFRFLVNAVFGILKRSEKNEISD